MSDADKLELARTDAVAPVSGETPTWAGQGAEPPPRALISARIGRYAILRVLGEGGMGVVYAAYDEQLDRKIALKLLHAERSGGTEGRARILREAQALARLSHPNVVQVHEVAEHERQVYVAMELVDGVTLAAWQRDRPPADVLRAYHQAGEGLDAAHRVGLVHRDFKPENALVGVDGRVRVVDFGLARAAGGARLEPPGPAAERGLDARMTASGATMGTPAYMSPEQFTGGTIDARSDVFSFSVALWEAIHGERPFAGETIHTLMEQVLAGDRRPPRVELPARLASALGRGLAVLPEQRWSTLRPLLDALAVDPTADPSSAPNQRRVVGAVMAAMASVLFAVMFATIWVGQEDVFRARLIAVGFGGCAVIAGLALAFRRTLLRNSYHRKVLLFLVAMAFVSGSQRMIGLAHGLPLIDVILDTLHVLAGMTLVAAICFARWFAIVTAIAAAGIVLALVRPGAFPAAMLVIAPAALFTLLYCWRRDAREDRS